MTSATITFNSRIALLACASALVFLTSRHLSGQSTAPSSTQVLAAAQANGHAKLSIATPQLARRGALYHLRQGDVIELTFQLCPEFNQDLTVQPDGQISLRGVPAINVEGQSLSEVTASVTAAYSSIMREPVVAVALKDFEKPYFIAVGEVNRPGKYDLRSSLTVTEALAVAGGFDQNAKHSQVVLFRPVGEEGFAARIVDIKRILSKRDLNQDLRMLPGDVLYVPKSKMSSIRPFLPGTNVFLNPFAF
jgi:polysaccharide biosynthesis/export protein